MSSEKQKHHSSAYLMLGLGLAVSGITILTAGVIRFPCKMIRKLRRRKQ